MKKLGYIFCLFFILISIQIQAQTWSSNIRLTWTSGSSWIPTITTDSGSGIHVTWSDNTPGNFEIFYKRSTDKGNSWMGKMRLTWTSGSSSEPVIATASAGKMYLVWNDDTSGNREIYFKNSTDSGANWLSNKRLTWNSGDSRYPNIATDSSSGLHMVWQDDTPGNKEIFYKHSTDDGINWSGFKRLTWNAGDSRRPDITITTSNVIHIVWDNNTSGNLEIYYRQSTDSGATWSGIKRLTWTSGISGLPTIDTSSTSLIHIAWGETVSSGNTEIFYKRSTDGGNSWLARKRLIWNNDWSELPSIAADSGTGVHVVWYDYSYGNVEIIHKHSTDSGANWSVKKQLTWNSGSSSYPWITADSSSGIHIVWRDSTPGNSEIYYKNRK